MNSHQNPLSVVIPTYNRADVLIKCLIHLENQTRNDFEVVVVDDGSTDSTPERIEAYAKNSPLSLRYLRQENRGPASARNYAISLVDAPICLIIGDDIFASPKLINATSTAASPSSGAHSRSSGTHSLERDRAERNYFYAMVRSRRTTV